MNRRPFRITEDGMTVNDRICFDIAVATELTGDQRREIEDTTNDRFEGLLQATETTFGSVTKERYSILIDTFIEKVVKPNCNMA